MFKDPKRQLYSDKKEVKSFFCLFQSIVSQVTFVYFHVINLSY